MILEKAWIRNFKTYTSAEKMTPCLAMEDLLGKLF
jgi:hypothetical protein